MNKARYRRKLERINSNEFIFDIKNLSQSLSNFKLLEVGKKMVLRSI